MPQNDNISAPFSQSTSATTVLPVTVGSASTQGGLQASRAALNSLPILNQKASERDSLLAVLDAISQNQDAMQINDIPGLDLFPELKNEIAYSFNAIASGVSKASILPITAATHASQLPLDLTAAIYGIVNSVNEPYKFSKPDASTLEVKKEIENNHSGFFAHCHALSHELQGVLSKLNQEIDKSIGKGDFAGSHNVIANTSTALPASATLTSSAMLSAGLDIIGSVLRDSTALHHFTNQESISQEEKNIYRAFSACINAFQECKNSVESLNELKKLENALSDFDQARAMSKAHSAISPSVSVLVRSLLSAPFVSALRMVNSASIALQAASEQLTNEREKFFKSASASSSKASFTREYPGGGINHSQNLTDLYQHFDFIIGNINKGLEDIAAANDQKSLAATKASSISITTALTMVPVLITDFVGIVSREFSGIIDFTQRDKGTGNEVEQITATRKDKTGADLDALLARASQLQERLERCEQLGVAAPVILGSSHEITCGGLAATLNSIAGMCFALSELHTLSAEPSAPTALDADEMKKAQESNDRVIASNKRSAIASGTQSITENVSLQRRIQSVMEKIVLIHRSKLNFLQPGLEREDINSSAKSTINISQGNSAGFLSGALGTLALVALESGIGTEALFQALSLGSVHINRLSDGVDNSRTGEVSQSNLSFLCNASRLSVEAMERNYGLQTFSATTNQMGEITFSRSLMVALCNSGALRQGLVLLSQQEKAHMPNRPHFSESALVSVAVLDKLAKNILIVLNNVEEGRRPISGLNDDMASQLGAISIASILTALSSHSILITPFLQSIAAAKVASDIDPRDKDEAVIESVLIAKTVSTGMNIIQAFTNNCIDELKRIAEAEMLPVGQFNDYLFTMQSHLRSNKTNAHTAVAMCLLSILCEEVLEMTVSRSLTLLDPDRMKETANQSVAEISAHANMSSGKVLDDSNSENSHTDHVLSALRLTLSHLGNSLARMASELGEKLVEQPLEQRNLRLHTSQISMMRGLSSIFSEASLGMVAISGVLSMLPLSSVGSVDAIRRIIHSLDHELRFRRIHSSAESTRGEDSETSLSTGVVTDSMVDMVLSITKMLLRASLFGTDISLSIAKVLEIACVNQRPSEAISLETKGLSQPNGAIKNLHSHTERTSVGSSVVSAIVLAETKMDMDLSHATNHSIDSLQGAVDNEIEQCSMLSDDNDEKLDLKLFYEILIRVLVQHQKINYIVNDDYKHLVERFHQGGIALSRYHSKYDGIYGSKSGSRVENTLIQDGLFMGCDDASALLKTFIYKATKDEMDKYENKKTLLLEFKSALESCNKGMTDKTKTVWNYVIHKVADNLYLANQRSQLLNPRNSHQNLFNRTHFIRTMTTENLQPEFKQEENALYLEINLNR